MTVEELLARCNALGVALAPDSEGKLRVRPARLLPDALREELRQRKPEVLAALTAAAWLRDRLAAGPLWISTVIAEWTEGDRDGDLDRQVEALMAARWALGVVPYLGEDECFWWRLPQERVQ